MYGRFDVVVLGSGTATSIIATQCQAANWRVAVVDRRTFGGTRAVCGCTAKKVQAHATTVMDVVNGMRDNGINVRPMGITWSSLMDFKHAFTNKAPTNAEPAFARQNIAC